MKDTFGDSQDRVGRRCAYGVQQIRLLTRSTSFLRTEMEELLDLAENTGVPIWLHLDSLYAWGSDTESKPEDAPEFKLWQEHDMREWDQFPKGEALPNQFPRFWFNWGEWCTPAPAVPALGSPRFVSFARKQLRDGILTPLRKRLERWQQEGRRHLFAGINIGWETHVPDYRLSTVHGKASEPIVARHPSQQAGLAMPEELRNSQLGYASLHWLGWDEGKLVKAAAKEGISRDEKFQSEVFRVIHSYQENLAEECTRAGLGPQEVFTHIVALASAKKANTNHPPIWTAVNRHSTPGFTMDQRGAARYDLKSLQLEIRRASGSETASFGVVEAYFRLGERIYATDADATQKEIEEMFESGARVQVFYGGFPLERRTPPQAIKAIKGWLSSS